MASHGKTIFCIGAGPGIGRSVTTLFALNGYTNVALISRREEQLNIETEAIQQAVGAHVQVRAYPVDVANTVAFSQALQNVEQELGKPDCIFYNAARVLPSSLLTHEVSEMEYDFKKYIPHLIELAKSSPRSPPAFIVTSSLLPQHPIPQLFVLSLVKAAQRNMLQSLHMTYALQGVFVGILNIQGEVSPEHETLNPGNIAQRAWEWYSTSRDTSEFEVII